MAVYAGIDIGSRTVKLVLLENRCIVKVAVADTTYDPIAVCRSMFNGVECRSITATGDGRHLFFSEQPCNLVIP